MTSSAARGASQVDEQAPMTKVVATDAANDGSESNEFDLQVLHGISKAAFDEQTIARVFYELEGAAPKLGETGIYLKQCTSLKHSKTGIAPRIPRDTNGLPSRVERRLVNN